MPKNYILYMYNSKTPDIKAFNSWVFESLIITLLKTLELKIFQGKIAHIELPFVNILGLNP